MCLSHRLSIQDGLLTLVRRHTRTKIVVNVPQRRNVPIFGPEGPKSSELCSCGQTAARVICWHWVDIIFVVSCKVLLHDVYRKCIVENIVVREIMVALKRKITHHRHLHVCLLWVSMVSAVTHYSLLNSCMYYLVDFSRIVYTV